MLLTGTVSDYNGCTDFRQELLGPSVHLLTTRSVLYFTDVRRFLLS